MAKNTARPSRIRWHDVNTLLSSHPHGIGDQGLVPGRFGDFIIRRCHVYRAIDGDRFVLLPGGQGSTVIFQNLRTLEPFAQSSENFVADIGADVVEAYRRGVVNASGSVEFAYFSISVTVAASVSGAVVALNGVLEWLDHEKRDGYPTRKKLDAVLALRSFLKRHAPKTWQLIFRKFLNDAGKNAVDLDSYSAEDLILVLATVLGKAGGYARLTSLLGVFLIGASCTATVIMKAIQAGVSATVHDYSLAMHQLIPALKKLGFPVTEADATALARDIGSLRAQWKPFRQLVERLRVANSND